MLHRFWIFVDRMGSTEFLALFVTVWMLILLGFNLLINRLNKKIVRMREEKDRWN